MAKDDLHLLLGQMNDSIVDMVKSNTEQSKQMVLLGSQIGKNTDLIKSVHVMHQSCIKERTKNSDFRKESEFKQGLRHKVYACLYAVVLIAVGGFLRPILANKVSGFSIQKEEISCPIKSPQNPIIKEKNLKPIWLK